MKPNDLNEPLAAQAAWRLAAEQACARIAPSWPLDALIAVNPWWEMRDEPFHCVSARLAALGDVHCLMSASWFEKQRPDGAPDVGKANRPVAAPHWKNIPAWLDNLQDRRHKMRWSDEVTHQISQFCAMFLQREQGALHRSAASGRVLGGSLYAEWLAFVQADRGIEILMGEPGLHNAFERLAPTHEQLFAEAIEVLVPHGDSAEDYLHALLLDVKGWAALCAYFDRYADAAPGVGSHMMLQLLAVRLAWELALWRHCQSADPSVWRSLQAAWQKQWQALDDMVQWHAQAQTLLWEKQADIERAYRSPLHARLRMPVPAPLAVRPNLQAVFCIDVRSEPYRRALEAQDPTIQTLGFAGFFGLPIRYRALGAVSSEARLPGLLKGQIDVLEQPVKSDDKAERYAQRLNRRARMLDCNGLAPTTFSLVESLGLGYAFKLFKAGFFPSSGQASDSVKSANVTWQLQKGGVPLTPDERIALVAGILRNMSLTGPFAPEVLLVGHGSTSQNNPHAAGLDCGACGGHDGALNARVLAMLLNDAQVRSGLRGLSIDIPDDTQFVAALHDTTTDEVICFDAVLSAQGRVWLEAASCMARRRRAPQLGIKPDNDALLKKRFEQRARDWSQPRPEWGLANNAAFIAAPRARTRHIDLAGRAFLHDYDWRRDTDGAVLELIMTAPMVVAHWINMQYYASVTDHRHYGSGNKILHNVVGGHLGVFEGNGGDLRIGLPLQSVHDGKRWRHEPLRLAAYLAAPAAPIEDIYNRHAAVKALVDNEWLHLFRLDDDPAQLQQLTRNGWRAA
ncbi:DUF2309 domain-containing protein [Pusillimonas sp. T2]|uniref:YbcC family protein n=1 Tax=Pusillimonas sp. T2 TaxID=1548123 RepID=UPI000B8E74C0|nr:DUF2309 domain-containing protein [Pusillimonas sp. T2]OXR50324.1 DUF2309 domain-containing protein [Pusillimonas sp. T2]